MPHKHVRKGAQDPSLFDLPPSQIARPLPVHPSSQPTSTSNPKSKKRKRARNRDGDDAPREFKRLMAFANGKKLPSGLDDGSSSTRSKGGNPPAPKVATEMPEIPKIRPGERMSEFAARVDAALPIAGLKKGGKDPLDLKKARTRKEKKMHRLYAQWHEEEKKIQEQKEEELEKEAERALSKEEVGQSSSFSFLDVGEPAEKSKTKKKGKRRRGGDEDDDPWLEIKRRRAEAKVGLHDVAQAPPELHKGNAAKRLTVHGAAVDVGSVPKASGSLRRREQLNEVRDGVVAAYRDIRNRRH